MVVWCSCTWEWCKKLRDENKVESTQHFSIPRSEHITDPDEKLSAEDLRAEIERKLRPGAKRPLSAKSTNGFLWHHLKPQSFEWQSNFSRRLKRLRSRWVVSKLVISTTRMTPPPYETEARWDCHNWVSVGHKPTIVASSSSFEVPKTHRSEIRMVDAAVKAVSNSRVPPKQKVDAVKQLAEGFLDYQAKYEASQAQLEALEAKFETQNTLLMNSEDKVDSLTLYVNKLRKENEKMKKKQREVQKTLKERLRNIRKEEHLKEQLEEQAEATDAMLEILAQGNEAVTKDSEAYRGLRYADFEHSFKTEVIKHGRKGLCNRVSALTGCRTFEILASLLTALESIGAASFSLRRNAKRSSIGVAPRSE